MRTIHKYDAQLGEAFTIDLPADAYVVHVAVQHDIPRMWVELNPKAAKQPRRFAVVVTGGEVPNQCMHLGTFLTAGGDYVLHLYESHPA